MMIRNPIEDHQRQEAFDLAISVYIDTCVGHVQPAVILQLPLGNL